MVIHLRKLILIGCLLTLSTGSSEHAWAALPAGNSQAAMIRNPVAPTPASIATGHEVFRKNCEVCHGADGKGLDVGEYATKPADLTHNPLKHGSSDGEIYTVIKDGVEPDFFMDAWGGRIGEIDLWNLVNYIRTLQNK